MQTLVYTPSTDCSAPSRDSHSTRALRAPAARSLTPRKNDRLSQTLIGETIQLENLQADVLADAAASSKPTVFLTEPLPEVAAAAPVTTPTTFAGMQASPSPKAQPAAWHGALSLVVLTAAIAGVGLLQVF